MSNLSGIVREGWLKRVKNQKKRYFVLGFNKETGEAQLQYYENPKKFSAETVPKRVISLQQCLGIIKKVDERFGDILVLYTKEAVFKLKADTDELLEGWLMDLNKLHQMEYKNLQELKYDIVWNVKVVPRGLGGLKNVTGSYKLCLKENTLYFINPVTQDIVIEEKLYHVRKFGYWEYCVFMEFGRSTALGPGEIWMEVDDPLIAQKIEDSLSRSVKPKSRPKSVVEGSVNFSSGELVPDSDNNNVESPRRSRRITFIEKITPKKKLKDGPGQRQHSNSLSEQRIRTGSAEKVVIGRNGSIPKNPPSLDEEEDSEVKHYPKITPPVPTAGQKAGEDAEKTKNNEYANIGPTNVPKPKRRSERSRKHRPMDVREDFMREYTSASLPRRTSSSSSSEPSWRHSVGSEKFPPSYDSDGTRESDKEDGDNAFQLENASQYIAMKPRQTIGSDSSVDEPRVDALDRETYLSLKPPSDQMYVQMGVPNAEKSRNTSDRSSDSNCSPEEGGGEPDPGVTTYVNMAPGGGSPSETKPQNTPSLRVTSSSSSEELPSADTEKFDHLNREHTTYVNMNPAARNVGMKKSHSQIQPGSDSAYVNVDINRSKSVGSNEKRFHIVSEQKSSSSKSDEEMHIPSYVNVKANVPGTEPANYANIAPQGQKISSEKSLGWKQQRDLNYASVKFSKDSPPRDRASRPKSKNSETNYSRIDFEKSNVLADIASGRERKQHHA